MYEAIKVTDFSVICGFRGEKEQNEAYARGHSKLKWPQSKHNQTPSMAVDIVPYPIDWNDELRFRTLGAVVKEIWSQLPPEKRAGYALIWGGDFKNFRDLPHFELKKISVKKNTS
jgi:peptidoglycan L-alanyl-D-glutamate endopeptidase CwlK